MRQKAGGSALGVRLRREEKGVVGGWPGTQSEGDKLYCPARLADGSRCDRKEWASRTASADGNVGAPGLNGSGASGDMVKT
jgi:hypothetical protein